MAHFRVGEKVRSTIEEIGGSMPEELPAVDHVDDAMKRISAEDGHGEVLSGNRIQNVETEIGGESGKSTASGEVET